MFVLGPLAVKLPIDPRSGADVVFAEKDDDEVLIGAFPSGFWLFVTSFTAPMSTVATVCADAALAVGNVVKITSWQRLFVASVVAPPLPFFCDPTPDASYTWNSAWFSVTTGLVKQN